MNSKIIYLLFTFLITFSVLSQQSDHISFSPFVSRLKTQVSDSNIILTWKNPKDTAGKLLIYRYTEQFNSDNIENTFLLGTVDIPTESFIDYPDDTNKYYYLVLVQDTKDYIHHIFVPYRNMTVNAVNIPFVGSEIELATRITGIKAKVSEKSIILTFNSSKPKRSLLVYRSTEPVVDSDNLLSASTPVTLDEYPEGYVDYPVAGIEYFYTVLDAELVKAGEVNIVPGENSFVNPVIISVTKEQATDASITQRSLPLPYLSILQGVGTGESLVSSVLSYLPDEVELSLGTKEAVHKIVENIVIAEEKEMDIQVLDIDLVKNKVGEDGTLGLIIQDYFIEKEFSKSKKLIEDFLKIRHRQDVEERSYFYLGQILFFENKYKDALLSFIMAMEGYYVELQPWINACFNKLILVEESL